MTDLTNEHQLVIIEQEIFSWKTTRYQLQIRYRVQKSIGGNPEVFKEIERGLEQCEKALDELEKIKTEIKNV